MTLHSPAVLTTRPLLSRRTARRWLCAAFAVALTGAFGLAPAAAEKKLGVVMLHGKNGAPDNPPQMNLANQLRGAGMLVRTPALTWARGRYIDGGIDKAMAEIAAEVAALRQSGAQTVILLGQSMGAATAVSYAALKGDVEGIVLSAPGHSPTGYQRVPFMQEALGRAKQMVAAGKGGETAVFADSDQGQRLNPRMRAADYVSWFDPEGSAEMNRMAAKVRPGIAALVVVGNEDRIAAVARATIFERLPKDPRHAYVEIKSDHRRTLSDGTPHFMAWLKARANDP